MLTHDRSCPKNSDLDAICLCDDFPGLRIAHPAASEPLHEPAPAMAARNGVTNPLGKLTYEVGKLWLPQEVGEELERAASKAGKPKVEYLRDLVAVHLFGADALINSQNCYLRSLEVKGRE